MIQNAAAREWLHFQDPERVIETSRPEEVMPKLCLIEMLVSTQGLFAAGFLSYEAASAFDAALEVRPPNGFPLLWFGIYKKPKVHRICPSFPNSNYRLCGWIPSIDRAGYNRALGQIREHLENGETYQVNYTFRLRTPFSGSAWTFFRELIRTQQADYAAYVDTGRFAVCSASPELFFRLDGRQLTTRPMKGTAPRGRFLAEDEARAEGLHHSEKDRAENIMILDMIRNDLGRIAKAGSIRVPHLFDVERYPTLWQMTSTVTAEIHTSFCEIMAALFPCASITGAPKVNTMKIIADLEADPRRVYTGCIGFFPPGRQAQFNVAIRTVLVDRAEGRAEYGVGSGIVWDSVTGDEYAECRLKAQVLTERRPDFSLLETMLWRPNKGYFLLARHLRRLRESADYFGFPVKMGRIREKLSELASSLPRKPCKVRLLVTADGTVSVQATPVDRGLAPRLVRLRLAPSAVDPVNPFLYHKTTCRQVYDVARATFSDCDDVLLWKDRGEITETTIANVIVELEDGILVTPPVSSGLLPGTLRARLLERDTVREKVVTLAMLKQSKHVYLVNSVYQWREAVLLW